jgi:uncharacterized repeat protein (TIGR01451 family)
MGRRLLLILGMILLASSAIPVARGQDDGKGVPGTDTQAPLPITPLDIPGGVISPEEPTGSTEKAKSDHTRPAPRAASEKSDPSVRRTDGNAPPPTQPPSTAPAGPGESKPGGPEAGATPPATDRLSDPASEAPATDPIPLGKQSVAVTVDVQGPASMNLNQKTIVRLYVRNTGTSNAINVKVHDTLPEGLEFVSSQPQASAANGSLLSWSIKELPAGSENVIAMTVKPVKTGPFDHVATVWFQVASKARSSVYKPLLKVDQEVSTNSVLKGQQVAFKIAVTNVGDGPAKNVTIRAKLSEGLRHGSGERNDEQTLELTLPALAPGQREELDTLEVDAIKGGDQSCTVTSTSPDVLTDVTVEKAKATSVKTVSVVEPKLHLTLTAPKERFTDTIAPYEIKVENPGTATARKVRVVVTLPVGGRLLQPLPPGVRYDNETRRIQWPIERIEPGGKPQTLGFQMRMGGVGFYDVTAEARGDGGLAERTAATTDVKGLPDVDLVVSERARVVDVGGKTTFVIRLRNYGTKEATNIALRATLSKNLLPIETAVRSNGIEGRHLTDGNGNEVVFVDEKGNTIKSLGPQKELIMGIVVQVTGDDPQVATCKVKVTHDDSTEPFEDMARVKVMPSGHARPSGP